MKVTIRDTAILRAIPPLELATYLRSNDWTLAERLGDKGAVWTRASGSGAPLEIILPLRYEVRDFAARMADALQTLEVAEGRSQLDILRDIRATSADVIRVELDGPAVMEGSLPLQRGVSALARTQELVLAAACAAVEPRPVYPTRKPSMAVDYMSKVRLGQTEQGSYVLTVISPVPPALDVDGDGASLAGLEDPFERSVTTTLVTAMAAARVAADIAASTGQLRPFLEATRLGVSANLCDAIAGLVGESGADSLGVRVRWAPSRLPPRTVPDRITFGRDAIRVVEEASRIFRETTPRDEVELQGMVVALKREESSAAGMVTVAALVDGALRKVRVELGGDGYAAAIRAHQEERRVRCTGRLVREGRSLILRDAHGFEVEAGD